MNNVNLGIPFIHLPDWLIGFMADWLVIPLVVLASFALIFKLKDGDRYQAYARILIAGLTALLIAKILATFIQFDSERPFQKMGVAPKASYLNNPGFPSDHTLFVAAIALAVWAESRSRRIAITVAAMALLVGLGRVYAGVHTPLDVVGGVVIALLGAIWYLSPRLLKK